jgi:hypothetical protein
MEEKDKTMLRSYIKQCEEYREKLAEMQRKSGEWESITRRLFYVAKESGALNEFNREWFSNEIQEAQGTLKKEDNPNRQ